MMATDWVRVRPARGIISQLGPGRRGGITVYLQSRHLTHRVEGSVLLTVLLSSIAKHPQVITDCLLIVLT